MASTFNQAWQSLIETTVSVNKLMAHLQNYDDGGEQTIIVRQDLSVDDTTQTTQTSRELSACQTKTVPQKQTDLKKLRR